MSDLAWLDRIAIVTMLVTDGLWAGGILFYAVERVNLWARMPLPQYVVDFRRSVYRADPLQPILGILAVVAAIFFAVRAPAPSSAFAWIGVVLIALVIVFSIVFSERINSMFRKRREGDAPPDAEALRVRWRRLHLIRTGPALASLVSFALAAAFVG